MITKCKNCGEEYNVSEDSLKESALNRLRDEVALREFVRHEKPRGNIAKVADYCFDAADAFMSERAKRMKGGE